MAGQMGAERVTTQNLEVVGDRRRRAVSCWSAARFPGQGWLGAGARCRQAAAAGRGADVPVPSAKPRCGRRRSQPRSKPDASGCDHARRGQAGSVELDDAIFNLDPRPDILQRMVRWQLAKRRAGTHHAQDRSEVSRHRQEDVQAEGQRRRSSRRQVGAAVPRRRQGVRPEAARPLRSTCPRRCARWRCVMRCRPRPKPASSSCSTRPTPPTARPRRCAAASRSSASTNALFIDGAELEPASPARLATFRTSTCCRSRASTSTTSCAARSWC